MPDLPPFARLGAALQAPVRRARVAWLDRLDQVVGSLLVILAVTAVLRGRVLRHRLRHARQALRVAALAAAVSVLRRLDRPARSRA